MFTEGNKQKSQSRIDPAFILVLGLPTTFYEML